MKLNSAQVQRALDQFEAHVIPDENPAIAELNDVFGDHTFFLDQHGLNIVEPVEAAEPAAECARVRQSWQLERRQAVHSQAARARSDGRCRDAGIEALRPGEQILNRPRKTSPRSLGRGAQEKMSQTEPSFFLAERQTSRRRAAVSASPWRRCQELTPDTPYATRPRSGCQALPGPATLRRRSYGGRGNGRGGKREPGGS